MPLLLAPAKLNLTLEVLSRRPDGYHGLRSVMVPIALFDRISIEPSAHTVLSCNVADLEANNIVVRALDAAGAAPASIHLQKEIPFGGGLGGGSSDAATILRAAMEGAIARSGEAPDWLSVARTLGSDVPFFLAGTGALVEGTGERVTAVGALPPWWCVVVAPFARVVTADAFRLIDASREGMSSRTRPRNRSTSLQMVEALQRGDFGTTLECMNNDFHDIVLGAYPAIAEAHAAFLRAGAARPMLSGSGSSLFALFEREADARAAAGRAVAPSIAAAFVAQLHSDAHWRAAA